MTTVNNISVNNAKLLKKQEAQKTSSNSDITIPLNGSATDSVSDTYTQNNNKLLEAQIQGMVDSLINDAAHIDDETSDNSLKLLKQRYELLQTMSGDDIDVSAMINKALKQLPSTMMKKACDALGLSEPKNTAVDSQNYSPVTPFQKAVSKLPTPVKNVVDKTTNAVNSAMSDATAPKVNAQGATKSGKELAQVASNTANSMGSHGWCLKGVNNSLEKMYGFRLSYPSAYMAADGLRQRPDQFKEVSATKADLENLPAGAIVVWDKDGDNPHGHISISLGNGYEASDHVAKQYKNISNSFSVFIPQDV